MPSPLYVNVVRHQDSGAGAAMLRTVERLFHHAGLDAAHFGTPDWNPLGDIIQPGQRVLLKPNWVMHANAGQGGLDCLITSPQLIEAVLAFVARARPGHVIIGDAPIQSCDFQKLLDACGIEAICERFSVHFPIEIADFRARILLGDRIGDPVVANPRGVRDSVLFDLADTSALEDITHPDTPFRVTMYDPDALQRTHAPGRHQYLVARDVLAADVVINLPKLKTHKKAGITGALKNVVGINVLKDYLPHHRKGGADSGGDCYQEATPLRAFVENTLDSANRASARPIKKALFYGARVAARLAARDGGGKDYEGSWHGNDTVWRMALDLQRILTYGTAAGTLAADPQRQVLHITDAVVAGEGEGPLAPSPVALGLLTLASNPAAAEFAHALLMQLDPQRIPLVRNALAAGGWSSDDVGIRFEGAPVSPDQLVRMGRPFRAPQGWVGNCELARVRLP